MARILYGDTVLPYKARHAAHHNGNHNVAMSPQPATIVGDRILQLSSISVGNMMVSFRGAPIQIAYMVGYYENQGCLIRVIDGDASDADCLPKRILASTLAMKQGHPLMHPRMKLDNSVNLKQQLAD